MSHKIRYNKEILQPKDPIAVLVFYESIPASFLLYIQRSNLRKKKKK